jgi:hypothetical protein
VGAHHHIYAGSVARAKRIGPFGWRYFLFISKNYTNSTAFFLFSFSFSFLVVNKPVGTNSIVTLPAGRSCVGLLAWMEKYLPNKIKGKMEML